MPEMPADKRIVDLGAALVRVFDKVNGGEQPGYRGAHARGLLTTGTFTPTAEAALLTTAPHFNRSSIPVTVRFSSFTGLPRIPDNSPDAEPRGFGMRFHLGPHEHTDIIAHATNAFPTRTGEELVEFFEAIAASQSGGPPLDEYVAKHPTVATFVNIPKPTPYSFAHEAFYALTAFKFMSATGVTRYGRYRIVPDAGISHMSEEERKARSSTFLYDEMIERISNDPVGFQLWVQLANDGDVTDDITVRWPDDREFVLLGTFAVDTIVPNNAEAQKQIIFDSVPRVQGIEGSNDPIIELRAAVYLISGRRRRAAHQLVTEEYLERLPQA